MSTRSTPERVVTLLDAQKVIEEKNLDMRIVRKDGLLCVFLFGQLDSKTYATYAKTILGSGEHASDLEEAVNRAFGSLP